VAEVRRIALLVSTHFGYGRGILRGVRDYARRKGNWFFRVERPSHLAGRRLMKWKPAGIILQAGPSELDEPIRALGVPVVNVSGMRPDLKDQLHSVRADDRAVGAAAAEYFLSRGFRNLAYYGMLLPSYSQVREEGFRSALASRGLQCEDLQQEHPGEHAPDEPTWAASERKLGDWLESLPKPVGVLARNDVAGFEVCEVCHQRGLHVPEEVAVVGVDNDELVCELSEPPLSSVRLPLRRIGFEAAALLDRLMTGRRLRRVRHLRLPPEGVVTRRSSDVLAIEDPLVAEVVRYIRGTACDAVSVPDCVARVPLSRRRLEQRFRAAVGRSIFAEIRRMRMARARELLIDTNMPVADIALRTGHSGPERFCRVFREETGMTPTDFRTRNQPA
jgi:LacI family transcriptional regulator